MKPFKEYVELLAMLKAKGMSVQDEARALRKIEQVGYYRLSGYWHTSRRFLFEQQGTRRVQRFLDEFQRGTSFESVFRFYLLDKSIRVMLTDALERIEVHLRTIIAHELGRQDPLAHQKAASFSKGAFSHPKQDDDRGSLSLYDEWQARHQKLIEQSREQSILSHTQSGKPIPIWVASEAWDFGAISKLYSILSGKNQDAICARLGIKERNVVDNWLINLNGLRNRCAHHSRICNRTNPRTLMLPQLGYFNSLQLDEYAKGRFYGLIAVVWYLVSKIGPNSNWLAQVATALEGKPDLPGLTWKAMGFPREAFPREKFAVTAPERVLDPSLDELCAVAVASVAETRDRMAGHPADAEEQALRKTFVDEVLELISEISTE